MKTRRLAAGALSIALAVTMLSTTAFAASVKFTDVPSSHWASTSISKMADKGIMSGIGNNLFALPNKMKDIVPGQGQRTSRLLRNNRSRGRAGAGLQKPIYDQIGRAHV